MTLRSFTSDDGIILSYRDFGPANAPAVVLCHGLGANGSQFLDDAAYFVAQGYRVLVPDLRGHGASGFPRDYAEAGFSIAMLAGDMVAMLDAAELDRVHWVGNSLGGIVALQMIADHSQRFASLATFGTAFALDLPAISGPALVWLYRLFGARLLSRLSAAGTTRHRQARPLVDEMLAAFDPRVGRAVTAHVRHYDLTANVLAFEGPMLVLVGGRDIAVNRVLRPALAQIDPRPNLTVIDLPHGGHMANLDAGESWRGALLEFWTLNLLPAASTGLPARQSPSARRL